MTTTQPTATQYQQHQFKNFDSTAKPRELLQCCVQFSLPLPVQDPTLTARDLQATSFFVHDMCNAGFHNEVAIALCWRVVETEDELDRLGAWFLIDQVVRDAIAEENLPNFEQRVLSKCISKLVSSMPALIRCRWAESVASNPTYAKPYQNMRRNWTRAVSVDALKPLETAFKEVREKGMNRSPFVIQDRYSDALWKLKLRQPRPSLALAVKQLFAAPQKQQQQQQQRNNNNNNTLLANPDAAVSGIVPTGHYNNNNNNNTGMSSITIAGVSGETISLKHSAAVAALAAHANVSGITLLNQNPDAAVATTSNNNNINGARVHERIRKWIYAVDAPGATYCAQCDVWDHTEANCPCAAPARSGKFNRRQAIALLTNAGVSSSAAAHIGSSDDLNSVNEILDAIYSAITRKNPNWTLLVDAFDVLRQRHADVRERRALVLLSSYNLPPSKVLLQQNKNQNQSNNNNNGGVAGGENNNNNNKQNANNNNNQSSNNNQTPGGAFLQARAVLLATRRFTELRKLAKAVLTITWAYIAPDLNANTQFREDVKAVLKDKSFLFVLHGVSSVPFGIKGPDGLPLVEGSGFHDGDGSAVAPPAAGARPFPLVGDNSESLKLLTDCLREVTSLGPVVHHLSRTTLNALSSEGKQSHRSHRRHHKKDEQQTQDGSSHNENADCNHAQDDEHNAFFSLTGNPQQEPWDFYIARGILQRHGLDEARWPQDEETIRSRIESISNASDKLRLETAVWLVLKRRVPYCTRCKVFGHARRRCVQSHRSILEKLEVSEFELRLNFKYWKNKATEWVASSRPLDQKDGKFLEDACRFYAESAFPDEFATAVAELKSFRDTSRVTLSLAQYFPQIACKTATQEGLDSLIPKIMTISSPEFPSVCLFCSSFHHDSATCPTQASRSRNSDRDRHHQHHHRGDDGRSPYEQLFELLNGRGVSVRSYCQARALQKTSEGGSLHTSLASLHKASLDRQMSRNPQIEHARQAALEIDRLLNIMEPGQQNHQQQHGKHSQLLVALSEFQQYINKVMDGTSAVVVGASSSSQQQQNNFSQNNNNNNGMSSLLPVPGQNYGFNANNNQSSQQMSQYPGSQYNANSFGTYPPAPAFDDFFQGNYVGNSAPHLHQQQVGYTAGSQQLSQYTNNNNNNSSYNSNHFTSSQNNNNSNRNTGTSSVASILTGNSLSQVVRKPKQQLQQQKQQQQQQVNISSEVQQQQQHVGFDNDDFFPMNAAATGSSTLMSFSSGDQAVMNNDAHQQTAFDLAIDGFYQHQQHQHHQHDNHIQAQQDVFDDILNEAKAQQSLLENQARNVVITSSGNNSKKVSPTRRDRDGNEVEGDNDENGNQRQEGGRGGEDEPQTLSEEELLGLF